MGHEQRSQGFTLIEVLIVAAVAAIITVAATVTLFRSRTGNDLKNATQQIATLLQEAQSRSITQSSGASWGVHFDNAGAMPFYALFSGSSYSTSAVVTYAKLPADLCYSTLSKGSSTDVVFNQVSGLPSATSSIGVKTSDGCTGGGTAIASSTIMVNGAGLISY